MAKWLILNGSPRINGQSAKVIRMLTLLIENKLPDVELEVFEVARHPLKDAMVASSATLQMNASLKTKWRNYFIYWKRRIALFW